VGGIAVSQRLRRASPGAPRGSRAIAVGAGWLLAALVAAAMLAPAPALACSPAFNPTIAELGLDQVVLLGETGEPARGGRLFYVERAWNADLPTSPIVIAFKEGEPVGNCSYPVASGTRLVIAPWRQADGTLYADLGTLQADPRSEDGQRYLAETAQLFGAGTVPVEATRAPAPTPGWLAVAVVAVLVAGGIAVGFVAWQHRQSRGDA
jgi:hypothetical protein